MKRETRKIKKNPKPPIKILQEEVGFIVTRCVRKPEHNILYQDCYAAIRKFHPELKIVIIDDNSDKTVLEEIPMVNVEIIQSDYPGAAEFLPYYYLLKRRLFSKAIILHDSMILNTRIPYETVDDYMFLYEFDFYENGYDERWADQSEVKMLLEHTNVTDKLSQCYIDLKWLGCWGSCMITTYYFLKKVEYASGFMKWVRVINSVQIRHGLERALPIVFFYTNQNKSKFSLFGKVFHTQWFKEGLTLQTYLSDKTYCKDKIIKIRNSR